MICQQNARELAAKSHESRRRNKELREQEQIAEQPIEQVAEAALMPDVSRVRAKLDKLDSLMDEAEDDRQWDAYSRAYERMFRVWCTLTKTPGPGNLKPSQAKQTRAQPVQPMPIPLAAVVSIPAQPIEPQAVESKP